MDNQKLNYFIHAADYLNFTKAAEACHVTQATMSRAIASLEAEIGTPLFARSKSGVVLTKAGQALASSANSYLEQYYDIMRACQRAHELPFPRLRIAAGPYEDLLIPEALSAFVARYPSAEFNFLSYTYAILASRITNSSVDFCFCTRECADSVGGLRTLPIYRKPWLVAARRDHPIWSLPPAEAATLENQNIVTMYRNDFEPVEKYCRIHDLHPAQFIVTNFLNSLLLMLRTSSCIAVVPPFIGQVAGEDIRMEDILQTPLTVEFVATYDPNSPNPGNGRLFDVCVDVFSKRNQA